MPKGEPDAQRALTGTQQKKNVKTSEIRIRQLRSPAMKSGEYAGKSTIQRPKAQVELTLATAIKYNINASSAKEGLRTISILNWTQGKHSEKGWEVC